MSREYAVTDLALIMSVLADTAMDLHNSLPAFSEPQDAADARGLAGSMTSLAKRLRSRVALAVTTDMPFEFSQNELTMVVITFSRYLDARLTGGSEFLETPRGSRLAMLGFTLSQELDYLQNVSRETSQRAN